MSNDEADAAANVSAEFPMEMLVVTLPTLGAMVNVAAQNVRNRRFHDLMDELSKRPDARVKASSSKWKTTIEIGASPDEATQVRDELVAAGAEEGLPVVEVVPAEKKPKEKKRKYTSITAPPAGSAPSSSPAAGR